jgi:hypothetical protein
MFFHMETYACLQTLTTITTHIPNSYNYLYKIKSSKQSLLISRGNNTTYANFKASM